VRIEIVAPTIGEAWMEVARRIVDGGEPSTYDGAETLELLLVTLVVTRPDPADAIIERLAPAERLAWMRANFTSRDRVRELGDADSYATRFYDYTGAGLDQVEGVVERLRRDPASRRAAITTLQPLTDTAYIPCVSLLDFFIDGGRLAQVAYCHSIDFGTKGFANLVELAALGQRVAHALGVPVGELTVIVKSAHVYRPDVAPTRAITAASI
jgi:thymidylate synthase